MAEGTYKGGTYYVINETVVPGTGNITTGLGERNEYPAIITGISDKVQIGQYFRLIENELGFYIDETFLNEVNLHINKNGELIVWSQRGDQDKYSIDEVTGQLTYTE